MFESKSISVSWLLHDYVTFYESSIKISPRPFIANTVRYTCKLSLQSIHIKRKASSKIYCILKNLIYCRFSGLQYAYTINIIFVFRNATRTCHCINTNLETWDTSWRLSLVRVIGQPWKFFYINFKFFLFIFMLANGFCFDLFLSRHLHKCDNGITGYIRWFLYCHFLIRNRRMELLAMLTQKAHKIIKLGVFQCDQY